MRDEKEQSADDDAPVELPPELQALEAELALLRPRAERLPREQVLFLAGQASVLGHDPRQWIAGVRAAQGDQRGPGFPAATAGASPWASSAASQSGGLGSRGWPAAFAAMTALAASLLAVLLFRPEPVVAERTVYVPIRSEPVASGANEVGTDSPPEPTVVVTQRKQTPGISSQRSDLFMRSGRATELQFRLFEHLLAERSYGQMWPSPSANVADAVNHSLWSASSLNELLDEPPVDSLYSPSSESSGAKS